MTPVFSLELSDEMVAAARIRWRIPVKTYLQAPANIPQQVFEEAIDHASSIAPWQQGEDPLKDEETLREEFFTEIEELRAATHCAYATGEDMVAETTAWADVSLEEEIVDRPTRDYFPPEDDETTNEREPESEGDVAASKGPAPSPSLSSQRGRTDDEETEGVQ